MTTTTAAGSPFSEALLQLVDAVLAIERLPAEQRPLAHWIAGRIVNSSGETAIVAEAERLLQERAT